MVSFGVTENGGSTWTTRRSLEGIANIDMHGALTGVTGINNVTFILDEENSRVGIGNVDLPEDAYNGIAIGANTTVTASYGIAIGGASSALGENSIAIGSDALAKAANGISLGEYAKVGEEHTGSVAIGSRSTTTAANQVSFGQWSSTKNEWTNRRSLAGISDIDMEGTINLGGTWTKNATSGEYESNGKGELTGVTKINGVVFQYIEDNPGLAIGGYMSGDYYYSLAIGGGAGVAADNATAVGFRLVRMEKILPQLAMPVPFTKKVVLLLELVHMFRRDILAASLSVTIVLRQLLIRWPSVQAQLQPSMERK